MISQAGVQVALSWGPVWVAHCDVFFLGFLGCPKKPGFVNHVSADGLAPMHLERVLHPNRRSVCAKLS